MKIKLKQGNKEAEIEYEHKWWGSEFHFTELFRIIPFLCNFFNLKEMELVEQKNAKKTT